MQLWPYSDFHSLSTDKFHAAHDVLLHLDQLRELLGQIWPKGTSSLLAKGMAYTASNHHMLACDID